MSVRTWQVKRTERSYTPRGTSQEFLLVVKATRNGFAWEVSCQLDTLPIRIADGKAKKLWQAKLYARRAAEKKASTLPW